MRDSYLDELDDILTQRSGFDDSFRNEISYYNSIPEISVDPQILSLYDRKTNVASNAERIINADTKSIKSIKRGIEETEMHLKNDRMQRKNGNLLYLLLKKLVKLIENLYI